MTRALLRRLALWLGLAAALMTGSAGADTKVSLSRSFAGNMNFVGTQVTMRTGSNNQSPCSVYSTAKQLTARLAGLPAGATVVSAQLYWAGSNGTAKPDYTVTFEGEDVSAPAERQYVSATIGAGYNYFGGAADVTTQVAAKGNGDYTFSGLTISNGRPYCNAQGVLGGFALLVIYSSPSEPLRVLNLYEGFQYFRNSSITLNLSNFLVPKTLAEDVTARLGHLTWEGDSSLRQNGEDLLFNNAEMTDRMNPAANQFNSASNINSDAASYGIDFDAYTVKPSSGLIKPNQTTATTLYRSGQDMVLLNAEIIAIPNAPTSDLSLTISRNGELQVGRSTSYTLVVRNGGPSVESGPITVTDTLPTGLNFGSASGTGWTCSAAGQTVTCTNPGPLAVGAALPAITLIVKASSAATYTNTATVTGKMFDNISANNSASDSSTAAPAGSSSYVVTTFACAAGAKVGGVSCPQFVGPMTAGTKAQVYITTVTFDATGQALATPLSTFADSSLGLRFALACIDPVKGLVHATFAGKSLPFCADAANLAWTDYASLTFPKGVSSVLAEFAYEDVGKVSLHVADQQGRTASTAFVVRPDKLDFKYVLRSRDQAPNKESQTIGFARAGEAFTIAVGARTASGNWAPSFGSELSVTMGALVMLNFQYPAGTSVDDLHTGSGNGFTSTEAGAVIGKNFSWNQAGSLLVTPALADYLGASGVDGPATPKRIGSFYPDHFETAAEALFDCAGNMACPANVSGAVYSGQPFPVNVTAVGLAGQLRNYAGSLTLQAYDLPGGVVRNPAGASLLVEPLLSGQVTAEAGLPIRSSQTYKLALPFVASDPRPTARWTRPTPIYLRAAVTMDVVKDQAGTVGAETITSKDAAVEGGIMVVAGRLQLAHAFGSELLKLPVRMNAQYWNGSAWENNIADSVSVIGNSVLFTECQKALASGSGSNNCNVLLLKTAAAPWALKDGIGTMWLAAPGPGGAGSAWLQVADPLLPWLPSTRARAVFGIYKSPLIYIREVY
jgi:MSHA biogenesis protein MshQ